MLERMGNGDVFQEETEDREGAGVQVLDPGG